MYVNKDITNVIGGRFLDVQNGISAMCVLWDLYIAIPAILLQYDVQDINYSKSVQNYFTLF